MVTRCEGESVPTLSNSVRENSIDICLYSIRYVFELYTGHVITCLTSTAAPKNFDDENFVWYVMCFRCQGSHVTYVTSLLKLNQQFAGPFVSTFTT